MFRALFLASVVVLGFAAESFAQWGARFTPRQGGTLNRSGWSGNRTTFYAPRPSTSGGYRSDPAGSLFQGYRYGPGGSFYRPYEFRNGTPTFSRSFYGP